MSLARLWLVVAAVTVYIHVNVWSATQGWMIELDGMSFENYSEKRYAVSILGIVLGAPTFLILLWLTRRHAELFPAAEWWHRLPCPVTDLPREGTARRHLQRGVLWVCLILPVVAQAHFVNKLMGGTVKTPGGAISGWGGHLGTPFFPWEVLGGHFVYDTVQFYPFYQPWLSVFVEVAVAWFTVMTLRMLFGRSRG